MKGSNVVPSLFEIRLLVAALGESGSPPWWASAFLSPMGLRFLTRVLPLSAPAAAFRSASLAAAREHGKAAGRGRHHLFLLPGVLEDQVTEYANSRAGSETILEVSNLARAPQLERLAALVGSVPALVTGPVLAGNLKAAGSSSTVEKLAALYTAAFRSPDARCYPFFE